MAFPLVAPTLLPRCHRRKASMKDCERAGGSNCEARTVPRVGSDPRFFFLFWGLTPVFLFVWGLTPVFPRRHSHDLSHPHLVTSHSFMPRYNRCLSRSTTERSTHELGPHR